MMNLTLTQNRSDAARYTRTLSYEANLTCNPCYTPVRRLVEVVDGKPKLTRITEVPYNQLAREHSKDEHEGWDESRKRTHPLETRTDLIGEGLKPAGYNWPEGYLALTEMDWVKAERTLAGLDESPEDDEIVDTDVGPGTDTKGE